MEEISKKPLEPHYTSTGERTLHPKTELPVYGLPRQLREYVFEMTRVYNCPREFVVSAVLSAISTVAGNRVTVCDGVYRNSLALWFVNVARSGSNKTQPAKAVMQSLRDIDSKEYRRYMAALTEWKMMKDPPEDARPHYCTLMVDDMTEESRHSILRDNPHGVVGYYPELKGFFDDLQRYNKSGAVPRVLRLWDNDTIKVTRKSSPEPIVIERPFMNILGDLQPDLLKSTFGDETLMSSGLPQRFLFCYPEWVDFPQRYTNAVDQDIVSRMGVMLMALWNNSYNVEPGGQPIITEPIVSLDLGSQQLYTNYYNALQLKKELAPDDYTASVFSKHQIQVLRLAGIIHVAHALEPSQHFFFPLITPNEMQYAIDCMDYFEQCAIRVRDRIYQSGEQKISTTRLLQLVASHFEISNVTEFARLIGKNRSFVARIIQGAKKQETEKQETETPIVSIQCDSSLED